MTTNTQGFRGRLPFAVWCKDVSRHRLETYMRRSFSVATLALFLVFFLVLSASGETAKKSKAPSISPAELHEQRTAGKGPLVIDVRTPEEYASGHIPGAVNIAYGDIANRIGELDAPNGVALYCMIGPRARKGEAALLKIGYDDVLHIEGGFAAWKKAGLPLEAKP